MGHELTARECSEPAETEKGEWAQCDAVRIEASLYTSVGGATHAKACNRCHEAFMLAIDQKGK